MVKISSHTHAESNFPKSWANERFENNFPTSQLDGRAAYLYYKSGKENNLKISLTRKSSFLSAGEEMNDSRNLSPNLPIVFRVTIEPREVPAWFAAKIPGNRKGMKGREWRFHNHSGKCVPERKWGALATGRSPLSRLLGTRGVYPHSFLTLFI